MRAWCAGPNSTRSSRAPRAASSPRLHTPTDGRAEPSQAAPAIAEAARAPGATILTGCAVRGVETKGGRVSGVVTEKGPIACDAVVLAGGAWSRLFCGNLPCGNAGIDFPQLRVLGSVLPHRPAAPAGRRSRPAASVFSFRKRLDGGYTIARRNANIADITPDSFRLLRQYLPTMRQNYGEFQHALRPRVLRGMATAASLVAGSRPPRSRRCACSIRAPREASLAEARRELARTFPAFAGMQVAGSWGGMIDVTPDAVPVIDQVEALPGFFLATGFSGHGFGIGPGAGRLIAELVTGDTPVVDPGTVPVQPLRPLMSAR